LYGQNLLIDNKKIIEAFQKRRAQDERSKISKSLMDKRNDIKVKISNARYHVPFVSTTNGIKRVENQ